MADYTGQGVVLSNVAVVGARSRDLGDQVLERAAVDLERQRAAVGGVGVDADGADLAADLVGPDGHDSVAVVGVGVLAGTGAVDVSGDHGGVSSC